MADPSRSAEPSDEGAAPEGVRRNPDESPEPIDMLRPLFREQPLPPEGAEAPPMWLWMTIFGVVLFAVFYLGTYVGDFSPYPWLQAPSAAPVTTASAEVPEVNGENIYNSRCANCHQQNGQGVEGVFPPLAQARWVTGDKGALVRILLHGLVGEIEVRGATYNGNMPAWGGPLSDAEIAAVLTHIRSTWGNDASEVTADEVAAVRANTSRSTPWTGSLLQLPENMGIPGLGEAAPADSAVAVAE